MSGGYRGQYYRKQRDSWGEAGGYEARGGWNSHGDYQQSPRGGGWYGGKGSGKDVAKVMGLMAAREERELAAEEKRDREIREEKERAEAKWKEEQAKKERDEFREEIAAQQKAFLAKLAKSTPTGKRRKASESGDEESDGDAETPEKSDYKDLLRKKARKQSVEAPIDAAEWADWTCSKKEGQVVDAQFPKMPAAQAKGLGILTTAEKVSEADNVSSQALRSKYKTSTGDKAKDRWARVDLIVGILAHHLEQEE